MRAARAIKVTTTEPGVTPPDLNGLEMLEPQTVDGTEHHPTEDQSSTLAPLANLDIADVEERDEDLGDDINLNHSAPSTPSRSSPHIIETSALTNATNKDAVMPNHTSLKGTPRHQRKRSSNFGSNSPSFLQLTSDDGDDDLDRTFGPVSPPAEVASIKPRPRPRPRPAHSRALAERAELTRRAAVEAEAAITSSPHPFALATTSHDPPRPGYLIGLQERAAAEAAAAEAEGATPTPPPLPRRKTCTPTSLPVPPPPPLQTSTNTSVREPSPEDTGRRIRRLTEFGLQRQKAVEDQKAKAAKAAARKIDREKAARAKGDSGRAKGGGGAASKKRAVRTQKS